MRYRHTNYDIKRGVQRVKTKFAIAVSSLALIGGGLGLSLAIFGTAHAAGNTLYVSTTGADSGNCQVAVSPCATVDYAISQSSPGDMIDMAPGTYTSGFTVDGMTDLTIKGAGAGSTIIAPSSLINTGVQHKYTASMLASVFVNSSSGITLEGMTVNGNGQTPGAGGPDALVFWNASSGAVKDSNIAGTYSISGAQTGQGIALDASGTQNANLAVQDVAISGFQKNGIDVINGNGATSGSIGTVTLAVEGGSITGAGPTSTIAQNGIVLWNRGGGTVTGSVDGTTISDFEYTPASDYATGILAYGGGELTSVRHSSFANCDYYLATVADSGTIDATGHNRFGGVSPYHANNAQLGVIEDKLLDTMDDISNGAIYILPNSAIATTNNRGIQAGVDLVSSGGKVYVAPGTYTEQVTITKSLKLIGAGSDSTTIQAPTSGRSTVGQADPSAGSTVYQWDYGVAAYALSGTVNVRIQGVTIDLNNQLRTDTSGYGELSGVFFRDVSGHDAGLYNSKIYNFGNSRWSEGVSIFGNSSLNVRSNNISDYGFTGIAVYGDNGSGTDPSVTSSHNVVTGGGDSISVGSDGWSYLAQNGIMYILGAGGNIVGNTVSNNTGPVNRKYDSIGIYVGAGSGNVKVANNTLNDNLDGVYLYQSSGDVVENNAVTGPSPGWNGIILWDANNNTVARNNISNYHSGNSDAWGIAVAGNSSGNNIQKYNVVHNVDVGVYVADASDVTGVHRNNLAGNTVALQNDGTAKVDATCNYWGYATGPASGNISGPATYMPWLTSSNLRGPCKGGMASGKITSPHANQHIDEHTLKLAAYYDTYGVPTSLGVQWAVRKGTCAPNTNTVAGNVDGYHNSYNWNHKKFTASLDISGWASGQYCFIFNPVDPAGFTPVRVTQMFYVSHHSNHDQDHHSEHHHWYDFWKNFHFHF